MLTHFETTRCSDVNYSLKSQLTDVFSPNRPLIWDYKQRFRTTFSTTMFIYLSKKVSTAASAAAQPLIEQDLRSHDVIVDRSPFPTTSTSNVSPGTKIKVSLPVGVTMVCSRCSSWKRSPVISHPPVMFSIEVPAIQDFVCWGLCTIICASACVWRPTIGSVAPPYLLFFFLKASWRQLPKILGWQTKARRRSGVCNKCMRCRVIVNKTRLGKIRPWQIEIEMATPWNRCT